MARAFVRQLGSQPGIQLNPVIDRTGNGILGVFDRTAAIVGRFTRGRIDKPFRVNRSNFQDLLGKPASISLSALNEAYVHAYEALQRGAAELVVYRLNVAAAANSWAVFTAGATSTFAVASTLSGSYTLAVKHLGCHNDGIIVKVHAATKLVSGTPAANDVVTVKVCDADGKDMHIITGSLTAGSVDEFGQSNYLPDVSALVAGDILEWTIPVSQTIATTADCYGKDSAGADKWAASSALATFSEGGTGYVSTDYDRAVTALTNGSEDFGYIMGGGTRAVSLITKLADLAYDTNRQFLFDVPGDLTVSGAIAFVQSLGFGTAGKDHYPQAYWAPLKSLDPVNGNVVIWGTSGAQVGKRCARNSVTNAYGLAKKNQPVAGIAGQLERARVTQVLQLSEQDLSDLADAKINPVIFRTFSTGTFPCFSDSLTCAMTKLSYRKLITVAEMSAHVDETVARYARDQLQLPMAEAIQNVKDFLEKFFGWCYASSWLVDSDDGETDPFVYEVARDSMSPADRMNIQYWLHYDGVARQIHVQQYIV